LFPRAQAASAYDYGFPEYGFSPDDLDNAATRNPYENADKVLPIIAQNETLRKRSEKCFGITISPDGNIASKEGVPSYVDINKDEGSPAGNCHDKSEAWQRVRMYIFDTQLMEATSCRQGDDEACSNVGMGAASTTTPGNSNTTAVPGDGFKNTDTSNQQCPSGSTDKGVFTVPTGEGLPASVAQFKIRLCATPEIASGMNVAITANVIKLLAAAKSQGVVLSGSSFRTTASQISLRKEHNCADIFTASPSTCHPPTARPGTSMHEQGLAIDFSNCHGGSACFNWLKGNAATYGLKNLPSESWHWSSTGN
jgi:hypothetical protein